MNRNIIFFCFLLIFLLVIYRRTNEKFTNSKLRAKIIHGIKLNYPEIENLVDLEVKKIPDSDKILIKDMIKLYPIKSVFFAHNLELDNYSNVLDSERNNLNDETLELKYNIDSMEAIQTFKTAFIIGNNMTSESENTNYGVQLQYYPVELSGNNRATISIEFNSFMDLHLTKIKEMNELLNIEEPNKKSLYVEVISKKTQKHEFFPYFKNDDVKALVLFKNAMNLEFISDLEGYFNILDLRGNRILTKCKIDDPYCKIHLPQKGPIFGRDEYIVGRYNPVLDKLQILEKSKNIENFIADFQDDTIDEKEGEIIDSKIDDSNYLTFLRKKECILKKKENKAKVKAKQYTENPNLSELTDIENLKPFQNLAGQNCIKHTRDLRDDYFYGGFDKDNNIFCYDKDDECFMFKNKEECEKMDLETLLSLPPPNQIKGIDYEEDRNMYDKDTLTEFVKTIGAEIKEEGETFVVKCPDGKYLEGTYDPERKRAILGGIFKDCSDSKHPNYESCAPGPSHHLAELITNKGNKVYDASKNDIESNFGNLKGNCIEMNIPEGEMKECDAEDEQQPCYVGERDSGVPSPSKISNVDNYNKFLGFNCQTRTLKTNTCKHNNEGVLSDVISFSNPLEEDYLEILDNQKLLEISSDYDVNFATDEEKYLAENLHVLIEKYDEQFENKNPNFYFNKLRYTIKIEEQFDMLSKTEDNKLVIYYKNKEEATLTDNNGDIYFLKPNDLIEIILKKDNHLLFRVVNPVSKLIEASYTSTHILEGEFGSAINFYVAQNNNTFLRNIKYKETVPKTILPYNPFIDVKQV